MAVASASITETFAWPRKIRRIGDGDVGRAQRGGRHLVEQRLEQMMIRAVDDRDPHRCPPQGTGGRQAAKAGTRRSRRGRPVPAGAHGCGRAP